MCRFLLVVSLVVLWKEGLSHPTSTVRGVPSSTTTVRGIPSPSERIFVCGDRIRELIRYACPQLRNQGYYTPRISHLTPNNNTIRGRPDPPSTDSLLRRLRRQIVKECCNQPCYEKNLQKYCRVFQDPPRGNYMAEGMETMDGGGSQSSTLLSVHLHGGRGSRKESARFKKSQSHRRGRRKRSLSSGETQSDGGHNWGHDMEMRTVPPEPEPVILPSDYNQ